jgi:hypothetical protein
MSRNKCFFPGSNITCFSVGIIHLRRTHLIIYKLLSFSVCNYAGHVYSFSIIVTYRKFKELS